MDEKSKKWNALGGFWPTLSTIESARTAAMQGCWAASLGGIITGLFAVGSMYGFQPVKGIDIYSLVDAALLLLLSLGIWKMSRIAAVVALIYFVLSKVVLIIDNGPGNPIVMIIFGFLYVNGVRGTFAYQKYKKMGTSPA